MMCVSGDKALILSGKSKIQPCLGLAAEMKELNIASDMEKCERPTEAIHKPKEIFCVHKKRGHN